MALKIRRGTEAQRAGIQFALGELVWTTDTYRLYVGDGIQNGGHSIAENLAGTGLTFNNSTNRLDVNYNGLNSDAVTEGTNHLFFTNDRAQDAVGGALVAGNAYNTGITFTYDGNNNRITAMITASSLPSQTGNNGKFLTTNGNAASWANLPAAGIASVHADTNPTLGGDLDLNSFDITGTGNINITGAVTSTSITTGGLTFGSIAQIVGTTINEAAVHNFITQSPSASSQHVSLLSASNDAIVGPLVLSKSRGSLISPAAVQTNDYVSKITSSAFTGSTFSVAGELNFQVTGTVTGGISPTTFNVKVQNTAGSLVSALSVNEHAATAGVPFVVTSYANNTARDAAILTPTTGMIIISGTQFQGWNGTTWAALS
jgi:hypothetical protein